MAGIIANNPPGGSATPGWSAPDPAIAIPALFISTADGDAIEASPIGNIATIDPAVFTSLSPWGFVRIWDFRDEANPVLLSTFLTESALNEFGPPDPRGAYSAHNVQVVGDLAFLSHYSEGVIALDLEDPSNPIEIARFNPTDAAFETQNGGIQNVWGIFLPDDRDGRILASDRNGGLYVLELKDEGGD